jgi:hypothetical protein
VACRQSPKAHLRSCMTTYLSDFRRSDATRAVIPTQGERQGGTSLGAGSQTEEHNQGLLAEAEGVEGKFPSSMLANSLFI